MGATTSAGCRRSILAMTRSAKSRDGDKYGSRWSSAAMGTNSSGKSCSIMGSSRDDLRARYGSGFSFFQVFFGSFLGCLGGRIHVIGGSSKVPQILPQLLSCPVDVGLHSAKRELHDLRDLVVRVVLYVAEDDASAILG